MVKIENEVGQQVQLAKQIEVDNLTPEITKFVVPKQAKEGQELNFSAIAVDMETSALLKLSSAYKIPFLSRDIFLDNKKDLDYITSKFYELIEIAKKEGTALAIAHPHFNTIEILKKFLDDIDKYGVKLVSIKTLVEIKNQ